MDRALLRLIRGGTLLAATREAAAGTAAALEVRVFSLLGKDPELAAQTEVRVLREAVIDRLRSLSADAWYSELTAEGSSIELLRLLAPHEPQPKLAVPFQEALIRHGSAVAAGEATVRDPAEWSNLLAALDVDHYRSAVANGLASEVARLSGPIAANFYEAYGSALANEGQVLQHDQLISSVFSAAARNDDAATLTWATELVRDHPDLLDGLQPADKVANLRAVVEDALKGSEPSDELVEFGAAIGVSLPTEEPEEDAEEDAEEA